MGKTISSWAGYGFMERGFQAPRSQETADAPNEYHCHLSPYISDDNKDALIFGIMRQFQDKGMTPQIIAPQGEKRFVVSLPKNDMSTHEVKSMLGNNYMINRVTTPTDAVIKRNYHIQIPVLRGSSKIASAPTNDLTNQVISLTHQNTPFQNDYGKEKIQWVPIDLIHNIREFDRGGKDAYIGSRTKIDNIKNSLPKTGFTDPLIIDYSTKDRHAYLCEGNHRLVAARELGLTHVPARVIKKNSGNHNRGHAKLVPGVDPDNYGWVPADMSPSQIGLVDEKNVIKISSIKGQLEGINKVDGVTSYLGVPGANDPEGAQYIIDQANITGPQIEASLRQANSPELNPLPNHVENENQHRAIESYLKWKYNWNEMDRFGKVYSDYSSGDTEKNLSILHGFTSDAWGDVCTCPMCSHANAIPSGNCSGYNCKNIYNKDEGDRLYLIRPGTNIIKKNVWKYNPDTNIYLCPDCKTSEQKISFRLAIQNRDNADYNIWDDLEDDPELKLREPSSQWYHDWQDVPDHILSDETLEQQGNFRNEFKEDGDQKNFFRDLKKDNIKNRHNQYIQNYPDHLTAQQVANITGVNPNNIAQYVYRGRLPKPDIALRSYPSLWHKNTISDYLQERNK